MANLLYIFAIISGALGIGAIVFFGEPLTAMSAPLLTARAAVATAFVVIPYCIARAIERVWKEPRTSSSEPQGEQEPQGAHGRVLVQAELLQSKPVKPEPVKPEPVKPEPVKPELVQSELVQNGLAQAELAQSELAQAECEESYMDYFFTPISKLDLDSTANKNEVKKNRPNYKALRNM